ncbi:MAG TPA: hypothetical protein VGK67_14230 [Myxococcales bacterium]|jgi:hypothetical protein
MRVRIRSCAATALVLTSVFAWGCSDGKNAPDAGPGGGVVGLRVSDSNARSCEVVLLDPDHAVRRLAFKAGADGRLVREGVRLATAFISKSDSALADADLGLELVPSGSAANVTVEIGHCYDRAGQPLAAAKVEVVR